MNTDGMVGLLDYREDGVTPFMVFFKDGLEIEKCVSTWLKLASHQSAGKKAQGGLSIRLCVLVCMCASVTVALHFESFSVDTRVRRYFWK